MATGMSRHPLDRGLPSQSAGSNLGIDWIRGGFASLSPRPPAERKSSALTLVQYPGSRGKELSSSVAPSWATPLEKART